MQAVIFSAGLGDVIRSFYQTDRYARVCETSERLGVILATHNPCVHECFLHHPNRERLHIVELPGQYDRLRGNGFKGIELQHALIESAGFAPSEVISNPRDYRPLFYAADDTGAADGIVIQPFAGGRSRNLPPRVLRQLVSACLETGRNVHLVTRSYLRFCDGRQIHDEECIPEDLLVHPALIWHRNLSVPATLNLIKNCAYFAGCHSSLLQAAWFEGKPVFALYPDGQTDWSAEKIGSSYSFGAGFSNTRHLPFSQFDPKSLRTHLRETGMGEGKQSIPTVFGWHSQVNADAPPGARIAAANSLWRQLAEQMRFRAKFGDQEVPLILFPDGWTCLQGFSNLRRWETTHSAIRLLLDDGSIGAELAWRGTGFTGEYAGQSLHVTAETRRRRYLVCGLQRTCTNLIQYFFNNRLEAPRVTQFQGGQIYWKHGWLPMAEHLRDIFVIVCVRHPLHWMAACYDYFINEFGKDESICPIFNPTWTFNEWLMKPHYNWPSPAERWNVMNRHWLCRVDELGLNATFVRAEDCQTEWLQRTTFSRVLAQYDPLLPSHLTEGFVPNRLTNTNQPSTNAMDPASYLHHTFLGRYTPESKDKVLNILDTNLMQKLGYDEF
jgi:hypothetical protein